MRIVLQRVARAAVTVGGELVGAIEEPGLVALVGVTHDDDAATAAKLAEKTWTLRELGARVATGRFGAAMQVELVNDGPFTLVLDSAELERPRRG